jgi:probable phosphoglycerate mutase
MHLYLIRHADPDYDRNTLTSHGFREAAALAERLNTYGLQAIYTSDAARAILTARPAADRLNLPYHVLPWLQEPDSLHIEQQGREYSLWDTFGETIRADAPLPTHADWYTRFPFNRPEVIQMWQAYKRQCDALIAKHGYIRYGGRYSIQQSNQDRIALFCHNGTILLLLAHLLELPVSLVWCGFYNWPSSVTTIHFEEHSEAWAVPRALGVADISHLYAAGLQPQPRGMGDWYAAYR